MKLELDLIEKLTKIITTNGLTEISVEDGEQAITIRKEGAVCVSAPAAIAPIPIAQSEEEPAAPKGKTIVSPMVGTFYASTSPEGEPFVEVGSEVSEGDVVCVIEAMKLMNEIKSEYSGKVSQICVKNGDPIEYGQVLMYLE